MISGEYLPPSTPLSFLTYLIFFIQDRDLFPYLGDLYNDRAVAFQNPIDLNNHFLYIFLNFYSRTFQFLWVPDRGFIP